MRDVDHIIPTQENVQVVGGDYVVDEEHNLCVPPPCKTYVEDSTTECEECNGGYYLKTDKTCGECSDVCGDYGELPTN